MNRVLIVKLSSMGDLVQALPAVSDAARAMPDTRFDWVVDETFAEVPAWHPAIDRVIVSAHRRWRKQFWASVNSGQLRDFYRTLREREYSVVVDAQTSLKSALVTRLARGERRGPDKHSVR
ncbi:MAG TPA: glycosyltransferase family 9 protein, partial [Cellvibrionaceae bacterium]